MPELHQPPSAPDEPDTVKPTAEDATDAPDADEEIVPVVNRAGQELGEVSGGGEVTDLGGDSPSS